MNEGVAVTVGGLVHRYEDGNTAETDTVTKDGVRVITVYGRGTGDDAEVVGQVSVPAHEAASWSRGLDAAGAGGDAA